MKLMKQLNGIIPSVLLLLFMPSFSLAGQANWNNIPGGKIVNGEYQIKCGEGSGWQK